MKLLLTSAASDLGAIVEAALGDGHEVVRTDLPGRLDGAAAGGAITACELGHDEATDELAAGLDAVVHVGFGGHEASATELIDYQTRCTYNLLTACVKAGVPRVVYLSTLRLLDDYEPNLAVTERWRSLPSTDPDVLAVHLGERVCREFAREGAVTVVALRLGFPIVEGDLAAAEASGEPAALAAADLGTALNAALSADITLGLNSAQTAAPAAWRVLHVQSPVPNARFLLSLADHVLGFPGGVAETAGREVSR